MKMPFARVRRHAGLAVVAAGMLVAAGVVRPDLVLAVAGAVFVSGAAASLLRAPPAPVLQAVPVRAARPWR